MRVLVCGGRDFDDADFVHNALCEAHSRFGPFEVVIHGDATGADHEAECWARMMQIPSLPMRAEWQRLGRAAGPIRNKRMLVDGRPDLVIAFPGGRGTENMTKLARAAGVRIVAFDPKAKPLAAA